MYKSLILAGVVLFFVIGLVTVISVLLIKAAAPDKNSKIYVMSVFKKEDRECAVKLSCMLSVLSVLGLMSRCEIIAVDMDMDKDEKRSIESSFCRERHITICSEEELLKKISQEDS